MKNKEITKIGRKTAIPALKDRVLRSPHKNDRFLTTKVRPKHRKSKDFQTLKISFSKGWEFKPFNFDIKEIVVLLIIGSVLLIFLHVLRTTSINTLPLYEQYEHIYNVKQYETNNIQIYSPIDYMFKFQNNLLSLFRIIPFIFGFFNTIILYVILKKYLNKKQKFFTILIAILSPSFLFLYGTQNSAYLPIFLIEIGILLINKQKYLFGLLSFLLAVIFNPIFIYIIILFLIISYDNKKSKNSLLTIIGIIILTYFLYLFNNVKTEFSIYGMLINFISDFGANIGIGLFSIVLCILGLYSSWSNKSKNKVIYVSMISLIIISTFNQNMIFILNLLISYFGALGLLSIINRKWESEILKNYVIILLFCGLIFSSGAYIKKISDIGPNNYEIDSLRWLNNNNNGKKVLSDYKYGFLIKSYSNLDTYTDNRYYQYSKEKTKINISNQIFMSRDIQEITNFFDRENIGYIWVNYDMKNGGIWDKENQGILLLLNTNRNFEKIYDGKDIRIWHYIN